MEWIIGVPAGIGVMLLLAGIVFAGVEIDRTEKLNKVNPMGYRAAVLRDEQREARTRKELAFRGVLLTALLVILIDIAALAGGF